MKANHTKQTAPRRPSRKFRDLAFLLPVLGLTLLATPLLSLFTQSSSVFGVPTTFIYVFGVWAGLIILAFFLSRLANRAE